MTEGRADSSTSLGMTISHCHSLPFTDYSFLIGVLRFLPTDFFFFYRKNIFCAIINLFFKR